MQTLGESFGLAYRETGGCCPRCGGDSPYVEMGEKRLSLLCLAEAREEEREEVRDRRQALSGLYLRSAGAWPRICDWSFATFREVCGDEEGLAALAVAERWLAGYYRAGAAGNLVLWGRVGGGKTGLAWSIVRDLCEHGVEAKIVNFRTLLEQMKDAYAERVPVRKWVAGYFRAPVVCFDDLGSEAPTRWARDQLLGLVDARYERGLPSIFLSNYALDELAARLGYDDEVIGRRIVSRMSERSTRFEIRHADRRLAA